MIFGRGDGLFTRFPKPDYIIGFHDAAVARPQPERREAEGGGFVRGERAKQYVESARREEIDYLDIPAFLRRQAD